MAGVSAESADDSPSTGSRVDKWIKQQQEDQVGFCVWSPKLTNECNIQILIQLTVRRETLAPGKFGEFGEWLRIRQITIRQIFPQLSST